MLVSFRVIGSKEYEIHLFTAQVNVYVNDQFKFFNFLSLSNSMLIVVDIWVLGTDFSSRILDIYRNQIKTNTT